MEPPPDVSLELIEQSIVASPDPGRVPNWYGRIRKSTAWASWPEVPGSAPRGGDRDGELQRSRATPHLNSQLQPADFTKKFLLPRRQK
jgi:hypothetical protein